jgi:long-chain acyl-CoA synthetase
MVCVSLKDDCECTIEDILAHCEEHLTSYKVPKKIKIMEELPKGPSGKIQRLKLRDLAD